MKGTFAIRVSVMQECQAYEELTREILEIYQNASAEKQLLNAEKILNCFYQNLCSSKGLLNMALINSRSQEDNLKSNFSINSKTENSCLTIV